MKTKGRNRSSVSDPPRAGGFTLIELSVVIATIGIAAALLALARNRTKASACERPVAPHLESNQNHTHLLKAYGYEQT